MQANIFSGIYSDTAKMKEMFFVKASIDNDCNNVEKILERFINEASGPCSDGSKENIFDLSQKLVVCMKNASGWIINTISYLMDIELKEYEKMSKFLFKG